MPLLRLRKAYGLNLRLRLFGPGAKSGGRVASIGPRIYTPAVPVFPDIDRSRGAGSLGSTRFVILILTRAAEAQLAARRSHNPKVMSSILTCRKLYATAAAP